MTRPIPSHQVFGNTLFEQADSAADFVLSRLDRTIGNREETTIAKEKLEIPKEAIREIIINAVIHRNYDSNASVQIDVFADRVEIMNPGNTKYQKLNDVSRATAKRDLDEMVKLGLLKLEGAGRSTSYRLTGNRLNNGSNGSLAHSSSKRELVKSSILRSHPRIYLLQVRVCLLRNLQDAMNYRNNASSTAETGIRINIRYRHHHRGRTHNTCCFLP